MKNFTGIVDDGGLVLYHLGISFYNADEHIITPLGVSWKKFYIL